MSKLIVAVLAFTFASPALAVEGQKRKIASVVDLETEIQQLRQQVENQNLDAAGCVKLFGETYERMWQSTPADYAPDARSKEDLKAKAPKLLQMLFETKIALRQRVAELHSKGQATRECTNAARSLLRAGRFMEDVLGQLQVGFPQADPKNKLPALKGSAPWLLTNSKFGKVELKSGDVLASRGTAFTSAAIARLGEVDAQFSHASLVYVDEKTGVVETIEAHIEIGSFVGPLKKWEEDGKVRAALFRHKDAKLAHAAAKAIREKVLAFNASHRDQYPYDFKMNEDDQKEMFCSEIIKWGFSIASQGTVVIPQIKSVVNPKNRSFIDKLGIVPGETFLPGDMELDGRFDLVAEWRDYSRIDQSHMHDAQLVATYQWMDDLKYRLRDSGWVKVQKHIVWNLRRWPLFSDLLKEKFPRNMSKSVIATVQTLDKASMIMFNELERLSAEHYARTGWPMTTREMVEGLEDFRKRDLEKYYHPRLKATLHHVFREY